MKNKLNFKNVFMPENNEEVTMSCEICCERLATPDNQIVFCELCNLGVHQFCYGNPLSIEIPEGDWHCDRCKFCLEKMIEPDEIKCMLCNYNMGSLKKIENNKWAHIICVNWIPEIYFENSLEKNKLCYQNEGSFNKRKNKLCYLCGSKEGYSISCEFFNKKFQCQKFFHVYCAKKFKIIFTERLMSIYMFDKKKKYIKTYCHEHLRREFMSNRNFGMIEGLNKEKNDKQNLQIQKEIIKNRTNLDDNQIRPEIYQENELEEFKFQYNRIYFKFLSIIYELNKEITSYLFGESDQNEVEEILNPLKKKYNRSSKYKRKKYLNNSFMQMDRKDKENCFFKVPAAKKKIKRNFLKLNETVNNPIEISIENNSLSSTSNNIHEERSDDLILNGNIPEKSKSFNETPNKILQIPNLEINKYEEDSPRYDNHSFDKLIPFTNGLSEPLENDLFHHHIEEISENDFFSFKDSFKRFEVIDNLKKGQILKVETLTNNETFSEYYDHLYRGKSTIMYLDNPFYQKPLDKIRIIDMETLDKFSETKELNGDLINSRLLKYERLKKNNKKQRNDQNDMEKLKEKINTKEEAGEPQEFITKITENFVYLNNFEFEGIPYLKNHKI